MSASPPPDPAFDVTSSTHPVVDEYLLGFVRRDPDLRAIFGALVQAACEKGSLVAAMLALGVLPRAMLPLIEAAAKQYASFPENTDPFNRRTVERLRASHGASPAAQPTPSASPAAGSSAGLAGVPAPAAREVITPRPPDFGGRPESFSERVLGRRLGRAAQETPAPDAVAPPRPPLPAAAAPAMPRAATPLPAPAPTLRDSELRDGHATDPEAGGRPILAAMSPAPAAPAVVPSPAADDTAGVVEPLRPGLMLGQFDLVRLLGRGSSSEVWRARDRNLEVDVALKLLRLDNEAPYFREGFLREARTVATLNHPNVVRVFNCGIVEGRLFIAMEHVEGVTLGDLLRHHRRVSPVLAIEAALCACLGLGHAAKQGFVHRDVKPDNIIVSRRGVVKVMDFGLGHSLEEAQFLTESGRGLVGSPPYMAPELIRQQGEPGAATDIYALGATIFQLATGRFPYEGRSISEILKGHLTAPVPRLGVFVAGAGGLEAIVGRMLKKDPAERYNDFRRVFMDLLGALHEHEATSFHESWGRGHYSSGLGELCDAMVRGGGVEPLP